MLCPCGSTHSYETCCAPYHAGNALPVTAEQLMRSRYSAFAKHQILYLKETTWPPYQKHFDEAGYAARSADSIWLGLEIIATEDGSETDTKGTVTFIAKSMTMGHVEDQKEKSLFRKKAGRWYYVKAFE